MFRAVTLACLILAGLGHSIRAAEDPVFSGPQAGEKLPPLKVRFVGGELDGKQRDVAEDAQENPLLVIFFHQKTRIAFQLARGIMGYADKRSKDGLQSVVVFLTADPTETTSWVKGIRRHFAPGVRTAVSLDGLEGPGAYGLNRNVGLTVLVAKQGKVTANHAIVQPSLEVDGPKIAGDLVKVLGGGPVPTAQQLAGPQARMRMDDPRLERMLRRLARRDARPDDVARLIEEVEEYVANKRTAQRALGQFAKQTTKQPGFAKMGTAAARRQLEAWARKFGRGRDADSKDRPNPPRPDLRPLLQPVINKTASPEQVDAAALAVEEFIDKNDAARRELGRIAKTVTGSRIFESYGTPRAREHLKRWAKIYGKLADSTPNNKPQPKK